MAKKVFELSAKLAWRISRHSGARFRDSLKKLRSRLPKTDSRSRTKWSARVPENSTGRSLRLA